jgi:hypothetical protein
MDRTLETDYMAVYMKLGLIQRDYIASLATDCNNCTGLEDLTAVTMKGTVFCDVMLWSPIEVY